MAIFSGLGALISGALFGGSLLAAKLIGGALAFGAQLGLNKLTNKQQKKQKFTAVQGEVQMGGDVPVDALLGTGKTRGQRAYYAKWGKGNKVNADVFILGNGWSDGLENHVYFYGEKKNLIARPLIGGEVAHLGVEGFGDLVSIRFYDGRPGQPVDQKLVNDTAGLGKVWKPTSRLSGLTYVVVERRYDSSKFDKGRPEFEWVLRGLREYDPTKDSTVAGGNGPQRLSDPSTWTHTLNPAIHRLNYQLGLRGLRSGRTLIGEGKSLGQLDLSSYFVAINYCRTLRKGKPIYQCSLWVNSETDHTEALSAFDDAMAGYGLNRRGLSGVVVGAPQIPVLEITEKDIPADRPKPRQPRKSAFDLFNHLSGQFTSPEAMWNPESLKPIVVNADVAADKRARQTAIDFLQVSDADIAQYLLNVRYRQNRKGGTATVPVSRRVGLKAMEGEWVSYLGKVWMISEWRCDEDLRFTFVLTEAGADIYDDGDIDPGPIVVPPTPPINPSQLFTVQNFDVHAGMIQGGNGFDVPALEFVWDPPDDPTITDVLFVYRIDGAAEEFADQCAEPEGGRYRTTKNVISEKAYVARATIKTNPDRLRNFTPWRTTSTITGSLNVQIGLGQVRDDVKDRFEELQGEFDGVWRRLEELTAAFSLDGAVGEIKRQELKAAVGDAFAQIVTEQRVRASQDEALSQLYTALTATVGNNLARLITEETARATADSALSSRIVSLNAEVDGNLARLATEEQARATADSALSSSITGVSADVNGRFAGGLVKFEAAADQSGVTSRFSVMLRANLASAFKDSGFYIEIYSEGGVLKSRFAVKADQFVIWNGGSNAFLPIVIENGELKLNIANIGLVRSGRLLAQNNKMDINLNLGTIEIYS
ncbi:tail fiber protein J [Sinorhizobium phage phi2LM21]|nr:tail fiber protein J [Sinorhizobium phage phi2LM21]OWZ95143.1 phage tail protein [Sinorhizobium sp. LM21]